MKVILETWVGYEYLSVDQCANVCCQIKNKVMCLEKYAGDCPKCRQSLCIFCAKEQGELEVTIDKATGYLHIVTPRCRDCNSVLEYDHIDKFAIGFRLCNLIGAKLKINLTALKVVFI